MQAMLQAEKGEPRSNLTDVNGKILVTDRLVREFRTICELCDFMCVGRTPSDALEILSSHIHDDHKTSPKLVFHDPKLFTRQAPFSLVMETKSERAPK